MKTGSLQLADITVQIISEFCDRNGIKKIYDPCVTNVEIVQKLLGLELEFFGLRPDEDLLVTGIEEIEEHLVSEWPAETSAKLIVCFSTRVTATNCFV